MAARDFETLVNDFIDEYGIGGGGPLEILTGQIYAVVGQTGELGKAVRWIRDANDSINNLWKTWKFLWFEHSVLSSASPAGIAAASQTPTLPAFSVRQWDRAKFLLNRGTDGNSRLSFMDYDLFHETYYQSAPGTGRPAIVTVLPNGTLRCESLADQAYSFYGAGWKAPTRLTIDTSVPDLPETFDRIILARAAIYYADNTDAPEVLEGAQAEYLDLLNGLQGSQLDSFEQDTMDHQDLDLSFAVPGNEPLGTTR